ncbi:MAG: L,D-transpeptidase family protein [Pseudomonadota bacterium]
MKRRQVIGLAAATLALSGCASKFRDYEGPEVTRLIVLKDRRKLYLMHGQRSIRSFDIDLGFAPVGHKQVEGDGKTPEGQYIIDRRNPNSAFHLSLGISYPQPSDVLSARELGQGPGGDIFIHGTPALFADRGPDWTWGCIAVTNREMEDIYAMVQVGTPISIYP